MLSADPARSPRGETYDLRMPPARARAGACAGLVALLAALVPGAGAQGEPVLRLPKPIGAVPVIAAAFPDRPERLNTSILPGPVDDTERVTIGVDPTGRPAVVTMRQRLVLHGRDQFIVRERSSAQDAEALEGTIPPVLKREAVVWQGVVDGTKTLAALLTLDPAVEAELLPVAVTLEWRGPGAIGPGGTLPAGAGDLVVTLHNRTARPSTLPTGDVAPEHLAGPLDALLAYAKKRTTAPPPVAGRGLPATLPARGATGTRSVTTIAPLRVTGTVTAPGGSADPAGTAQRPVPGGLSVDGVLQGDAEFVVHAAGPGTIDLDLKVVPTLDQRLLLPPRGTTWAEWARRDPTPNEVRDAVVQLVDGAAAAARDDEYAPYLGHHAPGKVSTSFRIRMAPPEVLRAAPKPLRPKPFGITLASVALLAILANGTALWRRL